MYNLRSAILSKVCVVAKLNHAAAWVIRGKHDEKIVTSVFNPIAHRLYYIDLRHRGVSRLLP